MRCFPGTYVRRFRLHGLALLLPFVLTLGIVSDVFGLNYREVGEKVAHIMANIPSVADTLPDASADPPRDDETLFVLEMLALASTGAPLKENRPSADTVMHGRLPPLKEMITSPFGVRKVPGWLSRRGAVMRQHNGVDIRARVGWPVVAFRDGTVLHAGPHGLSGLHVSIRHEDGMSSGYAHLSKILVSAGQRVRQGEKIGLVGCTGRTTGAHLHFALYAANREAIDPLGYLHSAQEVLRPTPEQIPAKLTPQQCRGPVMRGRYGHPVRLRIPDFKALERFRPPALPVWNGGRPQ